MLTYAFDLLYEIYLERGYASRDIPGLILTRNLTGIEIDDRAGALAAFALMMKAANRLGRRGFLRMEARPDVIVLEDVTLRLSDFNNLLPPLGYDLNVDRLAGELKTLPLALSGIWSQVSAYLRRAEGPEFEDGFEEALVDFTLGLADEIGLFDEAANNPFLVNQFKELRAALIAIADADTKQRDRTALEREFGKRTGSPRLTSRVTRIGADYRAHKNNTTYRMELDALLDRVEEAVRHPEALSKVKGVEVRLNEAVSFHSPLWATVKQFVHAKNFGSLIVPKVQDPSTVLDQVRAAALGGDMMLSGTRDRVMTTLRMTEALAPRYHVVVANPPYMTRSNMNKTLKSWVENNHPLGKHDLFAAFMQRCTSLASPRSFVGMVTIQNWMFLSSFEALRAEILEKFYFGNLVQIGYNSFPELNSKVVQASAFVLGAAPDDRTGEFINLNDAPQSADKHQVFLDKLSKRDTYTANAATFKRLPGGPIAYWVSDKIAALFNAQSSDDVIDLREGIHTGDNERFLRLWHESSERELVLGATCDEDVDARGKWVPYNKGGSYRKWYGNNDLVIAWDSLNRDAMDQLSGHVRPSKGLYFKEGGTWSALTSGYFGIRYYPAGHLFDSKGQVAVGDKHLQIIGQFNTKLFQSLAKTIMPTLDYKCGDVKKLPFLPEADSLTSSASRTIDIARSDWDAYETSWDFTTLPLLSPHHRSFTLEATYARLRAHWRGMTEEMKRLEEENNRIFIDAYGLQDELTPEVPIDEITLTCNPAYSIKGDMSDASREARLRERTVKEFISYAIGCMFGRYSLDAPGLILANQGDTVQTYLDRIPEPTFRPDADNIIPVLGDDRFEDDAYVRFRTFLSLTFGRDRLDENLAFLREALGESVRDYLAKRFFDDHVQRYKKRPIYWLVSSPKGAFQALIYMHRYGPDTLNTVLTRYVRPLRERLSALVRAAEGEMITASASAAQRNKAQKEIDLLSTAE